MLNRCGIKRARVAPDRQERFHNPLIQPFVMQMIKALVSKKRVALLPLLLAALLVAGVVGAQPEVTATLLAPEQPAFVGDPLELTLVVTHPAGYQVIAPQLGDQWGDFLIHSQTPARTEQNGDGSESTILVYDGRLFAPGEFSTPPLPVSVTDGSGRLLQVVAPPATVSITSVLVEGDTQLRDIKPQADLPYTNLLPWLAGGLLLAVAAAGGYWAYRHRQARLALAAVDNRLPHEIALDELERVARLGLPEQARFKEHYSLVADTIRLYLERTYRLPMTERTTGEVAAELGATAMDRGTQRRVVTFLQECDLVKFADIVPSEADAYELIAQGRMIVEATKPVPPGDAGGPNGMPITADAFSQNGQDEGVEVRA